MGGGGGGKSFFSPPATNCCKSYCKKLPQWQRQPGFNELEGRSRKSALGTHGSYRRVTGRIPGQLEVGERSSSLGGGGGWAMTCSGTEQGAGGSACARREKQPNMLVACVLRVV